MYTKYIYTCAQAAALVERAGLQPGERVLDLAAGTGWVMLPAARRVGPAGSVLGVDLTDAMLAVVRGGPDPTQTLYSRRYAAAPPPPTPYPPSRARRPRHGRRAPDSSRLHAAAAAAPDARRGPARAGAPEGAGAGADECDVRGRRRGHAAAAARRL